MKDVSEYPPPGDKTIVLAMQPLRTHEALALAYYLGNIDQASIKRLVALRTVRIMPYTHAVSATR
jgi:hypothetical protein